MSRVTGGPAFPELGNVGCHSDWESESGMTIVDYFAAKAMQALVTSGLNTGAWSDYADLAKSAYNIADEMIKARQE